MRSLCEVLQHTINPDAAVRKACTLRCHCKGLMQCPFAVAVVASATGARVDRGGGKRHTAGHNCRLNVVDTWHCACERASASTLPTVERQSWHTC